MSDFVDTMAYRGTTPWHGKGVRIDADFITTEQIAEAAGLTWHAEKVPALYRYFRDDNPTAPEQIREIEGQFTIIRSDTGESLGCTVGSQYEPFQNTELIELGNGLAGTGEARWETAGSLKEGRMVWGLMQVRGSILIRRRDGSEDKSGTFLLLNNSHDGSSHLTAMFTSIRVVCWNTNGFAMSENRKQRKGVEDLKDLSPEEIPVLARKFSTRHTIGIHNRADEAAEALAIAHAATDEHQKTGQMLADTPMDSRSFNTFVSQLLTGQDDPEQAVEAVKRKHEVGGRGWTRFENKAETINGLFHEGAGNLGADRFDALNAVTEFIDHQRIRLATHKKLAARLGVAEQSFISGQFGAGAKLKQRAVRLLTK